MSVAFKLSGNPEQQVTALYEWGNWVNGGDWLMPPVGQVDILYRELDKVEQTISLALEGIVDQDYLQQPAFGFYSIAYIEDTRCCIPLFDPTNTLVRLKTLLTPHPATVRKTVTQNHLWLAEFMQQ